MPVVADRRAPLVAAGCLAVGLALTPLVARAPTEAAVACAGLLLVLLCALFPVPALAAFVALNPLLAGVERGVVVPFVRLNEALLLPVAAGALLALLLPRHTTAPALRRHPLDLAVLLVGITGSVTPLLWMYARDRAITGDDLQYAATLWKLAVLYGLVRLVVRDGRAARTVLVGAVAGALVVGLVGLLQAVGVGPVLDVLTRLTPPEADGYTVDGGRATSTLGNPIAYGDVMVYAAVIASALAVHTRRHRGLLVSAAVVLVLCALASGQVSVLVGMAVAVLVFAVTTRTLGRAALAASVVGVVALPLLEPVLAARLGSIDVRTGLPTSWTGRYGRLENLRTYFWPELGSDWNWLLGVRPAARVPGAEPWRDWVYIESGYTWLLWTGGLPLLAAAGALVVAGVTAGRRLRAGPDAHVVAVGTTVLTTVLVLVVLLLFDPHLTLRGGAELLFVLLALAAGLDRRARATAGSRPRVEPAPATAPGRLPA